MKKILLPLILLAGMTLVGCGGGGSPEPKPEEGYGVAITNKTELQAQWYAGEASRDLAIDLTPAGNVMQELTKKTLTVASNNDSVVKVQGISLHALAKGTAEITVTYHGWKDKVSLSIDKMPTVQEKYGVTHSGTSADPLTNEEALTVAKHADYAKYKDDLYVGGKVASFYHAPGARDDGAVSWFLEPAQGQTEKFEIYKCYKTVSGKQANLTDDDVWVGGYAVAHGKFTKYNSQYETDGAIFDRCEGTKPAPRTTIAATFAEALAAGAKLADGADTYDYYKFDAFVTAKEGDNYFLTASKGEELVKAKSDAQHGEKDYYSNAIEVFNGKAVADLLQKDAKITVTMILKNYHGQVENLLALATTDIVVVEEGEPWVEPEPEKITVAQAIAKINAIDISGVAADKTSLYVVDEKGAQLKFEVSGIIVKVGSWSSQYGNGDAYIQDEAGYDAAKALQLFRINDKAVFDRLVADETKVSVVCTLCAYVRVNEGVPSIGARETGANPVVTVSGDVPPQPEPEKITVTQALEKINAIDISGVTADKTTLYVKDQAGAELQFEVSGIITKVGSWSSQYGNGDAYIQDEAGYDAAKALQLFRINDKAVFDKLVADETEVSVVCKLAVYVRVNEGVPSISARETNANPVVTISGEGGGEGGGGEEQTALASANFTDKALHDWTYVGSGSVNYYSSTGIKLNSVGIGVKSPSFEAQSSVKVTIGIGAINTNTKTAAGGDHVFTVEALAGDTVVATQYVDQVEVGSLFATLTGTGITAVRITYTAFFHNGTAYCNVALSSASVEAIA